MKYVLSTMWARSLTPGRRRSWRRRQIAPLPREGEGAGVRECGRASTIRVNLCQAVTINGMLTADG